jgi:hypothetical protein
MTAAKLAPLLETRKQLLPTLELNAREHDKGGSSTNLLAGSRRFIGVADYVVNGDAEAFRRELAASAQGQLVLLDRFDGGGEISSSYASMTGGYQALLDALAATDDDLAHLLASKIGGREAIETKNDHPFDRAMGYALKAAVLQSSDRELRLTRLAEYLETKGNRDFRGYAIALSMLEAGEPHAIDSALAMIVEGHRRQSKGAGVFKGRVDESLCVWGIAIANLLISRGRTVTFDHRLLPQTLLRTHPEGKSTQG